MYLALFPELQLLITKEYGKEPDGWPVPLRSCLVDVFQPVSENVFASIQEYPLWWPEHDRDCDFLIDDGILPGSVLAIRSSSSSESTRSSNWANTSGSRSPATRECLVRHQDSSFNSSARCTCLRLPFDYIGEISFLRNSHIIPSRASRFSSLRQLHPDIRIIAAWNKPDRISNTLLSLLSLFDFINHPDRNPLRNGCNVLIRAPCVALVPFANAVSRYSCTVVLRLIPISSRKFLPRTPTFTWCSKSLI